MKTYTLQDGRSKVPSNPKVYKNQALFDKKLLGVFDTVAIYEEVDPTTKGRLRLGTDPTKAFYSAYRFYSNGYLNEFFLHREEVVNSNSFNPEYQGSRGVFHRTDGRIRYTLFSQINGVGWIGKLPGTLTFRGDTLYDQPDLSTATRVYVKRQLPKGYPAYKPNW